MVPMSACTVLEARSKGPSKTVLTDRRYPPGVVGEGVLFDVFFSEHDIVDYRSTLLADKERLGRFNRLLRERGVFKGDSKFYLSTAHGESDVEMTVEAIESAVDELSG